MTSTDPEPAAVQIRDWIDVRGGRTLAQTDEINPGEPGEQMSTSTSTSVQTLADRELKAKHRGMWALGNYHSVVTDVISDLGPVLAEATGIAAGDRVLDVAAGSGNAAFPAARAGADVVASDLTPELLDIGRSEAGDLSITWEVGDAEALPYDDASFDAVISCVGVMFAPHHQSAADELVRVCRPGGRIGLLSWTPEGFIGQMFATMKPYAPPPPPGAQPPPLWGSEDHVRELLGDRVEDFEVTRQALPVGRFATAADFREFFKTRYGPTIAVYRANAEDATRGEALDRDLDALAEQFGVSDGSMVWEYLLVTAKRR
jgi:SAM-dependent methyltransferase